VENVYVFGISWRHASSERIEAYTIPAPDREQRVASLRDVLGLSELCYLATCNRVELTCVLGPGQQVDDIREALYRELHAGACPSDARRELRVWGGEGAAEHLFLLAAGLDSAQLGEQEIAGQLRRAIELSRSAGSLGPQLLWLFEQVLKVGKRVQTESGLRRGRISIAEIAVDVVRKSLEDETGTVALVGVTKMTERCAESLSAEGVDLLFANRTYDRAQKLADRFGGRALGLDDFKKSPPPLRALISATGATQAVFDGKFLAQLRAASNLPPLLIDLALPADMDESAAAALGLPRMNMDQINERAASNSSMREQENIRARELVDEALERLRAKVASRALSPLIGELYNVYRETANRGLERELGKRVKDLSEEQENAVRRFAEELARRLAHIPAVGLRAIAAESGIGPVRTFLSASDDPMTQRLSELAIQSGIHLPEDKGQ